MLKKAPNFVLGRSTPSTYFPNTPQGPRSLRPRWLAFLSILILTHLIAAPFSAAEIKTITATGEYRMGDNDTRTDAKKLALLDAKRLALEQAGTYLESVTEVKNLGVARDELNAYTAGIVEVTELSTKDEMESATHIVRVRVTAKIDTDIVSRQIDALRKNESAKAELMRLRTERDQLRQDLTIKTRELAAVKSEAKVKAAVESRQRILTKLAVRDLIIRARAALDGYKDQSPSEASSSALGRENARKLAEQAIVIDPSNPDAHYMRGLVLYEEGNREAAVDEYLTFLRLVPDAASGDLASIYTLGRLLKTTGDLASAIMEYRSTVRLKPQDAEAHFMLGLALMAAGDVDEAIKEFREVVLLRPKDADGYYALGSALIDKGRLDQAAREFRQFLILESYTPDSEERIKLVRAMLRELER